MGVKAKPLSQHISARYITRPPVYGRDVNNGVRLADNSTFNFSVHVKFSLSYDGEYTLCKRTIYWISLDNYYNAILGLYSVAADYSSNEHTDVS